MFDQMREIAFDESRDVAGELGMPNNVAVNRDNTKIKVLMWQMGRMAPKVYGDKVLNEHTGEAGGPVRFVLEHVGK